MDFFTLPLLLLVFVGVLFFTSSRARKKANQAREEMLNQLNPGVWVMTIGRMYARVVDVDGQVVVLETTDGTEMLFDRAAIAQVTEPPFGTADEASADEAEAETDLATAHTALTGTDTTTVEVAEAGESEEPAEDHNGPIHPTR